MLIVSMFTIDYAEHADRLRESCKKFGYRYWIHQIGTEGSWEKNCARKPAVILDAWYASGEPILWLDADAVIMRRIMGGLEFEEYVQHYDFAVFRDEKRKSPKHHFRSGTLYFNHTDAAIALLAHWVERCEKDPDTWDQQHLYDVWTLWQHTGKTRWLPETYCKIFDRGDVEDPHIVHFQASRQLKAKVNA